MWSKVLPLFGSAALFLPHVLGQAPASWGACDPSTCLDVKILFTADLEGRYLPVLSGGGTCDPLVLSGCNGGAARTVAYVTKARQQAAANNQSVMFLDVGGSTFGGPLNGHPDYSWGMPETILHNMMPYDACTVSSRDFMTVDHGSNKAEMAAAYAKRTCPLVMANARFNNEWADFDKTTQPYAILTMLNGWKVGVVGMMNYAASLGYTYTTKVVDVDRNGLLNKIYNATLNTLSIDRVNLQTQVDQFSADNTLMDGWPGDVLTLATLGSYDTIAAAEQARAANPDLKFLVLLLGDNKRMDQADWMAEYGPFDIILRETYPSTLVQAPRVFQSKVYNKSVLVGGAPTVQGVGSLQARLVLGRGVQRFKQEVVVLNGSYASNATINATMVDLYGVIRSKNAKPYGNITNDIKGGHRGGETPPVMAQCYYTDCAPGVHYGRALLRKARASGYKADLSLSNLGGFRAPLKGDANHVVAWNDCRVSQSFQNTLKLFHVLGKDLLINLMGLWLPQERGFMSDGVRYAFYEPCWKYVNHTNYTYNSASVPPGSADELAACRAANPGMDINIKIIDVQVKMMDWSKCPGPDYSTCDQYTWKPLEKGTTYTVISTDFLQTIMVGLKSLEIALGVEPAAMCEYIQANSPLQVDPWTAYRDRGAVQYATPEDGWATGNRAPSVMIADSRIMGAPTCPDGMYLPDRALACMPCPMGTQSTTDPSRSKCDVCGLGFFGNATGMLLCLACPGGYFAKEVGATACGICQPGTVSDKGAIYCNECKAGSYAATTASLSCAPCEIGTYVDINRASACVSCPENLVTRYPASTSPDKCICAEGTYRPFNGSGDGPNTDCYECPDGMECPLGSDMAFLGQPRSLEVQFPFLKPRYWASFDEPLSVFTCRSDRKCPGGDPGDACAPHLVEQACDHCELGWSWDGTQCVECTSVEISKFMFPVLPLLIIIFIIVFLYTNFADPLHKWGSWQNTIGCLVFVTINHYQIINLIKSANVVMPPAVSDVFNVYTFTNNQATLFKLSCSGFQGFEASTVLGCVAPAIVLGIGVVLYLASFVLAFVTRQLKLRMQWDRLFNVLGSLMFSFFTGIAAQALLLFKCAPNPNKKSTLASDASVICFDSQIWKNMLVVGVIAVLVYCLFMGSVFVRATIMATRNDNFTRVGFQTRWKFLFIKFRADVHWFSLVFLFKNFLINLGFVIFLQGVAQLYWVMTMVFVYTALIVAFMPYRYRIANMLEIVASVSHIYCSSLLTWYADHQGGDYDQSIKGVTIFISFIPLAVALSAGAYIFCTRRVWAQRFHDKLHKDFLMLKDAVAAIGAVNDEDGIKLLSHLGEWDRFYLGQAAHILQVELLGQRGWRVTSKTLSQEFGKAAKEAVMSRSLTRSGGLPSKGELSVPVQPPLGVGLVSV